MLVVQRRRVLVERDDVAVGQLGLALLRRAAVHLLELELRYAGTERRGHGLVAAHGHELRAAHAEDLVVRLGRAEEVEMLRNFGSFTIGCDAAVPTCASVPAVSPIATQRGPAPLSFCASASLRTTRMSKCEVQ